MSLVLNEEIVLLPSASRTTTQSSGDLQNLLGTNLVVSINTTAIGTGSLTVTIDGKDLASGTYFNLLTSTAITTNLFTRLIVGSNATAAANLAAKDYLPPVFRIVVTANNANAATYSVGYTLIRS